MALTEKYVNAAGSGSADGSSEANAMSWTAMITDINAGGKAGNRYNVKGAVNRGASADTISGSGTSTSPVVIRGYGTATSDGYQGRTNGNGPLVTTNMPLITYTGSARINASGSWLIFESLEITAAANGGTLFLSSTNVAVVCKVTTTGTGVSSSVLDGTTNSNVHFINCDAYSGTNGTAAIRIQGSGSKAIACRVNGGPVGILMRSGTQAVGNTIFGVSGPGISVDSTTGLTVIFGNTIVGCTGDGIDIASGTLALQTIINNIITDNGGYGIDLNASSVGAFLSNNRLRDNTSGPINLGTDWATATSYGHVTTDTGGPETDYQDNASNDYRLIGASPAKGAGLPAYASVGALQPQSSSSATTASVF
jgi:hypothetical protein